MKTVHRGRWIKLYRAEKNVHAYPGLHLWLGAFAGGKGGHLRIWPLPMRVVR